MRERLKSMIDMKCDTAGCGCVDELLRLFGMVIHALQDLYSHSNYVETMDAKAGKKSKQGDIAVWDMGLAQGKTSNVPAGVITGTYRWPLDNAASPSHGEMNKDSAGSTRGGQQNDAGVTYFALASDVAARASKQLWQETDAQLQQACKDKIKDCCAQWQKEADAAAERAKSARFKYSCFPAGTPVHCPGGPRPIESIAAGDWVLTYDLELGTIVRARVLGLDVHHGDHELLELNISGKEALRVTPGHWFFDGADWVLSEGLDRSGQVLAATGKGVPVSISDRTARARCVVYNVRTTRGTYLVGDQGLLVSGRTLADLLEPALDAAAGRSATG
jgi:hypothetical protein